jgi:hypothetical protein
MKIIITEEQYNELINVDDVYDGLSPYFRRRIEFIDIPQSIEQIMKNVHRFYENKVSVDYLVKRVISTIVWETIPAEMGSNTSKELFEYHDIMSANIMDKYGEYIKRLIKKKLGI